MISRRKLLIALGASSLAPPLRAFAQPQGKVWRIGFLVGSSRPASLGSDIFGAFLSEMRKLGYVEGRNLVIEWRFADGNAERLPGLAAELVQLKVDVVLTNGNQAISAAQKATATIPIVMGNVNDPVGGGFVKSLARPEGNITGLSTVASDISAKYLELLLTIAPRLSRIAVLMETGNRAHVTILKNVQAASRRSRVTILPADARSPQEIESAFLRMVKEKAQALIVASSPLFREQSRQIGNLAVKHRLPSVSAYREFAEAGVLMSYGPNIFDLYRRAATYVDKILKGAKPADLPVEQPTKFELFINGRTAKALRLRIPNSLLVSADKVIE